MADVMVVVSKAVFEKAYGKHPQLGAQLAMDRYTSANKAIAPVGSGGKLYCVTVRPPDESLWLVAVLDNPQFDGDAWISAPATTPITDITSLRGKLRFESGKGITAAAGALGMSLQTPRVMTAEDATLITALLPQPHTGEGFPAAPKLDPNSGERAQGDALVEAVIAEPYADLPRQVFADALQARNDPRGEFVMLELALAGPLAIRKRDQMKARRDELFERHSRTWFPTELEYRTRGGFITAICGAFGKISAEAARLFATQPIVEASITHVDAGKLAKAPWLRHIRELSVRGAFGDKGFATLVAAANVQQVTSLNVTATGLGKQALAALGAHLANCRTLVLTANLVGDEGAAQLAEWPHLGRVETLYLSGCSLSVTGVTKLLGANLASLAKLTLSKNRLDNTIGLAIAKAAPNLPRLEVLELLGNKLDGTVVKTLAEAKLPAIRRIDVRRTRIGKPDVEKLPIFRAGHA
jgi:uncharacterized protein (TIGR02996 family)